MITEALLLEVGVGSALAKVYASALDSAATGFDITTKLQQAAWLAQVLHESSMLTRTVESFAYSDPDRLYSVFNDHFKSRMEAADYLRRGGEAIANRVYANRMGNGDEASGDGWRFRGRGLLQITGQQNYALCGMALNLDLIEQPELLEQPLYAARSAGWYWANADLNRWANVGDTLTITRRINGGTNGLQDRIKLYQLCLGAMQ